MSGEAKNHCVPLSVTDEVLGGRQGDATHRAQSPPSRL